MSTRRQFIKQVSLVAGWAAGASMGLLPLSARAAAAGPWHMPDEGDRHQRAFIAFGAQDAIWEDFTADVQAALGRIARTIARYEPLTVFCREHERDLAERHCGTANITYVETELDDIWMRDISGGRGVGPRVCGAHGGARADQPPGPWRRRCALHHPATAGLAGGGLMP